MRSSRPLCIVGVLAAGAVLAPVARPDGGRTPVWTTTTISAPGHYYLTRDITDPSPVITIASADVVLDLNGHTIVAEDLSSAAILVTPPASSKGVISIRQGRIRGPWRGVWSAGPSPVAQVDLHLEDLDISTQEAPIVLSSAPSVEIARCNLHDCPTGAPAVWIEAGFQPSVSTVVSDSVITSVGGPGIYINGAATGVIRNTVVDRWAGILPRPGISIEGPSGTLGGLLIEGNTLRGQNPGAEGILISTSAHRTAVRKNLLTGTMGAGIVVQSNGNALTGNVVGVNAPEGISVPGHDNTLHANQVTASSGNGIAASGHFNVIDANTVVANGGFGLALSGSNNVYRGNMLRNNAAGAVGGSGTDGGGNIP